MYERTTLVDVPAVGPMLRVEALADDGEVLYVEYRWAETEPAVEAAASPLPELARVEF